MSHMSAQASQIANSCLQALQHINVPSVQSPRAHAPFHRGGGCQGRRARACPAAAAARARRSARRAHSRPPGRTGGRRSAPRRQSCAASLATSWAARAGPPRRQKRRLQTRRRAAVSAATAREWASAAQHARRCQHGPPAASAGAALPNSAGAAVNTKGPWCLAAARRPQQCNTGPMSTPGNTAHEDREHSARRPMQPPRNSRLCLLAVLLLLPNKYTGAPCTACCAQKKKRGRRTRPHAAIWRHRAAAVGLPVRAAAAVAAQAAAIAAAIAAVRRPIPAAI